MPMDMLHCRPKSRHILVVSMFFGLCLNYMIRVNINVTLLSMVNDTVLGNVSTWEPPICKPSMNTSDVLTQDTAGSYRWDRPTQGIILGAFFWGYLITQLPGGLLSQKFGPKWVGFSSVLICSLLELCIPFAASVGPALLVAVRVGQGLAQGPIYPTVTCLMGRWIPTSERSRSAALIFSGPPIGTVLGQSIAGFLSQTRTVPGSIDAESQLVSYWSVSHYLFGSLGLLFLIIWVFTVFDEPESHPHISQRELLHLQQEMCFINIQQPIDPLDKSTESCNANPMEESKLSASKDDDIHQVPRVEPIGARPSVPWKQMLQSLPFWSILICHTTYNWSWYTLITSLPQYMARVLGFSLSNNGVLSSIPYLIQCVFAQLVGLVSDRLIQTGTLSVTWVRKINNVIALGGIGGGLLLIGFFGCRQTPVVVIFALSIGLMGASNSGFSANIVDLAPPFAGIIFATVNVAGTLPGILGPLLVGFVTRESSDISNWRIVFGVATGLAWFGVTINLLFTSSVRQPWATMQSPIVVSVKDSDDSMEAQSS